MTSVVTPKTSGSAAAQAAADAGRRSRRRLRSNLLLYRVGFFLTFLAVWWLAANVLLANVLPGIGEVAVRFVELMTSAEFYRHFGLTARRVVLGFGIAYIAAVAIGTAMGRSRKAEAFFETYIVTGVSQPGVFVAMIVLVALGLKESSAIVAMIVLALPALTVNFWQGTKRLDQDLEEMAQVFGYSRRARLRHVILPQLAPYAVAAARSGLGSTWKYVLLIELLGLSDGVGYRVNRAFQTFRLVDVLAWTMGFMVFVVLTEYLLVRRAERRIFGWRDRPTGKVTGAITDPDAA